jgi:hypothetical protein
MEWIYLDEDREHLWTPKLIIGFHEAFGNTWVTAQLAVSQEGLSSTDLEGYLVVLLLLWMGSVVSGMNKDDLARIQKKIVVVC